MRKIFLVIFIFFTMFSVSACSEINLKNTEESITELSEKDKRANVAK